MIYCCTKYRGENARYFPNLICLHADEYISSIFLPLYCREHQVSLVVSLTTYYYSYCDADIWCDSKCPQMSKTWILRSQLRTIKASSNWFEVELYSNLQYDKIYDVLHPDTESLWWSMLCKTIIQLKNIDISLIIIIMCCSLSCGVDLTKCDMQ